MTAEFAIKIALTFSLASMVWFVLGMVAIAGRHPRSQHVCIIGFTACALLSIAAFAVSLWSL